jgi:hypothetical protein
VSTHLILRFPPVKIDNYMGALVVGVPHAEFGEEVQVAFEDTIRDRMWVAGVDSAPLDQLHPEIPSLFGERSPEALHDRLCRVYGTGLPINVAVTLYTLVPAPPEQWEFEENV